MSTDVEKCFQHCHNVQTETQSGPSVLTLLPRPKVRNSILKVKKQIREDRMAGTIARMWGM